MPQLAFYNPYFMYDSNNRKSLNKFVDFTSKYGKIINSQTVHI